MSRTLPAAILGRERICDSIIAVGAFILGLQREFGGEDFARLAVAEITQFVCHGGVGGGEDLASEERGVGGAGLAYGESGDGDSGGHLDDGIEGVDSGQGGGGDGNAQNRQPGFGGDDAGQMGGAAGAGDDGANAAGFEFGGVIEADIGGAMGGDDARFERDGEVAQYLDGFLHDLPIVGAAHHDGDERRRFAARATSWDGCDFGFRFHFSSPRFGEKKPALYADRRARRRNGRMTPISSFQSAPALRRGKTLDLLFAM